jgi:hypothetical protein
MLAIAISLTAVIMFSACSDDSENENNNSNPTLQTASYTGKTVSGKTYTLTITGKSENLLRSSGEYTPQAGDTYELTDGTITSTGEVKSYTNYVMILIAGLCSYQEFSITIENNQISVINGVVEYMSEEACLAKEHNNEQFIVIGGGTDDGNDDGNDGGNDDGSDDGSGGGGNCTDSGFMTVNNFPAPFNPDIVNIVVYDYDGVITTGNLSSYLIPAKMIGSGDPLKDNIMLVREISGIESPAFSRNGTYTVQIQIENCTVEYQGNIMIESTSYFRLFQVEFSCGKATVDWNAPSYDPYANSGITIIYPE